MKYTDKQIADVIFAFMDETEQTELRYVVNYCLGYFGYITKQIWRVIESMMISGIIE